MTDNAEENAEVVGRMGTDGAGNCSCLSKVGWDHADAAIGLVAESGDSTHRVQAIAYLESKALSGNFMLRRQVDLS